MNTTATATANTAVLKPKTQRKPKAKLPPALAHELDVLRAARMGIDISYMTPDERCKYPSKFCCNKRARKSTGKLHRFCEDHRSRANVNQKRWTDIRRHHEQTQDMIETSLALCTDDAWVDVTKPLLVSTLGLQTETISFGFTTPRKHTAVEPSSPTHVEDDIPLSEDDIDMLTTIVAMSEEVGEPLCSEDAWLMSMLLDADAPLAHDDFYDAVISVL